MMKLIIFTLLFSISILAAPGAKVEKLKGEVLYEGKQVKEGDVLAKGGVLEVKEKSYVKLFVEDFGSSISVAPKSSMKLAFSQKQKKSAFSLVGGTIRWQTLKEAKQKGFIRTKNAVFGVRGTDFLVLVNPLLGESEIVCFDGKVKFSNRSDKNDSKVIEKNQWGGIGGRFGSNTGDILTLPASVIDYFKTVLE